MPARASGGRRATRRARPAPALPPRPHRRGHAPVRAPGRCGAASARSCPSTPSTTRSSSAGPTSTRTCARRTTTAARARPGGQRRYYAMPIFASAPVASPASTPARSSRTAQRIPGVPPLTPAQDEALDLWADVCEELAFTMELRAGRRPAPEQPRRLPRAHHLRGRSRGPGRDRFLMRLWLSMPNSRALPPGFEPLWGASRRARCAAASPADGGEGMTRKRVGISDVPRRRGPGLLRALRGLLGDAPGEERRHEAPSPFEVLASPSGGDAS